jgi:hypothetical protein
MLLAGIIPGTLLLKAGSDWVLKSALGLLVVGIALEMFLRKPVQDNVSKVNSVYLIIIGVVSGVLAGMYGIGALLVAYISRTTDNRSQFRANICCVFLIENIFRFFTYLAAGILNREVLVLTLLLLPAVILGMAAGIKADKRMSESAVRKFTIGLLIISGFSLFIKSVFFH